MNYSDHKSQSKEAATEWLLSGNPKKYDCISAFRNLGKIDWKQSTNVHAGDIVYIYISGEEQRIRFKCKANKVNLTVPDIEDSRYDISGEFDGTYGRYMELEMIQEFDCELFSRTAMEKHGFSSPQGPVRVMPQIKEYLDVVEELLSASELDPDQHDGSYELVRSTVEEYAKMPDLYSLDYTDLNLVYLMTVGTWRQKIPAKKDTVMKSHLPQSSKQHLIQLLDSVWAKAENGAYSNCEKGNASVGLFGTGFFTFKGKTDDVSPKNFIKMCIDIKDMDDDQEIFQRCAQTLDSNFRGMKAASASMILHCFKPFIFPVFNANMGSENIFSYLGVPMKWLADIEHYINNVKLAKSFRDRYFKVRNYRIYDLAAWKTGNNISENKELGSEEVRKMKTESKTEFDKNMILYGPPGTGKTYNTALYAVAICDGKSIAELTDYDAVIKRYRELKAEGRIAFTTFHQSYGYEEFVEGISPVLDDHSSDLLYTIEPGVFKRFCDLADAPEDMKKNPDASIWLVRLAPEGKTENKERCFSNGELRFDMPKYRGQEQDQWFTDRFVDKMQVGDYVLSYADDSTNIDAVGIIDSEAVYDENRENGKWSRKIYWNVLPQKVNVREINSGKYLSNYYICEMTHMKLADLLRLIPMQNTDRDAEDNDKKPYVFIIDEINRGNISKIFGELITLIEDTKRKGMKEATSAVLPYSKTEFSVPQNVYILGTMNTADRSIAMIDTALRRRFSFIEMMPDADVLRQIGADKITEDGAVLDVATMLQTINRRIEYLYDREHTIGHAFFTCLRDEPTVTKLSSIFKKSIIPLLQEYFYEDYQKIMMVLGDNGKTDDNLKFILDVKTAPSSVFRGDSSDLDVPECSYKIQDSAFDNIQSYIQIIG